MAIAYPHLSGDFIRVLDVAIIGEHLEPVCSLRVVPLDDPPEYTAISYCWDDPTEVARIKFQNGESLPLSQTLLDLFNSLKKKSSKLTLWIDAICINQGDTSEKEFQVPLMGRIYSCAKEVLVWLGNSDSITQDAFRFMKADKGDSQIRPEPVVGSSSFYAKIQTVYRRVSSFSQQKKEESGLESALLLLQRPWFQRVWVIQEVTAGSNIQVGCGDDRVGMDQFSDGVSAIWNTFTGLGRYQDDHPAILGFWCVTRMISIREEYQKKVAEGQRGVCYETLLQAAFHCQATRSRDKVFAFHGIADSRPVPKANYRIAEDQVYIDTAKALLYNGDSLDLLALSWMGYGREHSTVPTWAPDLRCHAYDEPLVLCNSAGWDAGGHLVISPQIDAGSPQRLRLQAKSIDPIDELCPPFASWIVKQQKAAVDAVLALRTRLADGFTSEAWMDKLAESLIMGLDIDDEPLRVGMEGWKDYRQYFDEWLGWIQSSSRQKDLRKIESNKYHRTIRPRIDTMKTFATSRGLFGIGPEPIQKGDIVFAVPGCRVPLMLRPDPTVTADGTGASPMQTWSLVSWCFVEGLMFGKAENLDIPLEEVVLR
ncbi:heterokaryon incompatibility protein het-6 [Fusarium heterosporum]|uniref:Heterokaryon incompatibility protein het-6 n=1 Tax=Fusarium heterosporum TaxID=42747 RepID=A0A8H5TVM3_FUSHE|nr:heterokaryon incompatibility protein het-6 [Fusarium heterosporum]